MLAVIRLESSTASMTQLIDRWKVLLDTLATKSNEQQVRDICAEMFEIESAVCATKTTTIKDAALKCWLALQTDDIEPASVGFDLVSSLLDDLEPDVTKAA